jgi:cell division protein FtsI (penicillin-binding protein 3)/stage V sporulation protein D (sporulation-specific penicillin-binding protein)
VVAILLACVFSIFSARLIHLQVGRHEEFAALAAQKNSIRQIIPARRGRILDARGEVLATDRPTRTVVADGSHITDPQALAALAAPFLEIPEEELAARLQTERKYVVIRHGLPEEQALALTRAMRAAHQRGLYFETTADRIYPNGPLLGHVLGFLNFEGEGIQGIEMTMNAYLEGHDGFRHIERDRTGREMVVYRGLECEPKNGADVELTIDMALQAMLEEELEKAFQELKPQSISGVLVRPSTGEVLAMANRPHFDPNRPGEFDPEAMKNRVIIDMVEPGSTFKIVAMAAALNEGHVTPETMIFCENGRYFFGGRTLRDAHPYGSLSVHDVLVKSSNIGSSKLAQRVGEQTFYEYIRRFGFGERTGIDLPGEITGVVHPPHRWSKISITRIPMGHEVAVTPLQITMATAAIANGGKLMAPQIVRRVVREDGEEIFRFQPTVVREVCEPATAEMVRSALADVVGPRGTARLAAVEGYSVGGKTGTAQRVDPRGGYTPGKYVVSFVGFLPAENPEFVGLIIVDDATSLNTRNYGGLVAAPIFSRVAERVARYLDIPPTAPPSILADLALDPARSRNP